MCWCCASLRVRIGRTWLRSWRVPVLVLAIGSFVQYAFWGHGCTTAHVHNRLVPGHQRSSSPSCVRRCTSVKYRTPPSSTRSVFVVGTRRISRCLVARTRLFAVRVSGPAAVVCSAILMTRSSRTLQRTPLPELPGQFVLGPFRIHCSHVYTCRQKRDRLRAIAKRWLKR